MSELLFRAMGTDFHLHVDADGASARRALAGARDEIDRLESVCSRFRPTSDLSRLNGLRRARVSRDLMAVIQLAIGLRELTEGWFDPAVGAAVLAAGYDRPFDEFPAIVEADDRGTAAGTLSVEPDGEVSLGPGTMLDLGGIAKGYAADVACGLLDRIGPAVVSAGGDIVASRPPISGGPWPVGISTPDGERIVHLNRGAIATSGVDRRRWRTTTGEAHHVVDPTTGHPSATDLLRVTVAAGTGAEADALATALLAAGAERGRDLADRLGIAAIFVTRAGTTTPMGVLA
ncbi:MAG: FAD:protein FMN transferase [Actinobacteria bacterium]|nr:FAD:protein FMN transferase [Thermoleophilia bacterium]MCB9011289.1 FAD:protein FMN transferase [Actinomycetota bacterium]